ncbi:MAG: class I SAM-dependent RNA methyltransferase [Herpetosiphon sp.]
MNSDEQLNILPASDPWPDEVDVVFDGLAQGGDAVAHYGGRAVFAAGVLPGEQARVRLRDRQRRFARGNVVERLHDAPERIASPCPLEGRCGAGDWRWIDGRAQLAWKQRILADQLRHLGGIDLGEQVVGALEDPGDGWAYRTTAELHVADGIVGYFLPGGRQLIEVHNCCLHHPLLNQALAAAFPLPVGLPMRGLTMRCAPDAGEVLAVLDLHRPVPVERLAAWAAQWRARYPALVGVVAVAGGREQVVTGRQWLIQYIAGLELRVGARSFFQGHARMTAALVERVVELANPGADDHVLDLFCGVGTFALPLARRAKQVIGVESWSEAIKDAQANAAAAGLDSLLWHTGPVETVLPTLGERCDIVVLDPPRRGCEPAVLDALVKLRARRIVYVSCHPGTLARDCRRLVEAGYHVVSAEVVDMFPQTHHLESIVTLQWAVD